MFRKLLILCFLVVAFSAIYSVNAQENNGIVVEVSKEKTTINGKTYYLHTVKKGENLYRISRAYNITQKDIIIANPEAISGVVKEGQVLKIPTESLNIRGIQQIESDNFIHHITEEQQTIFFLTQKYAVSKEDLIKYNPELEFSPLQVGQVVRIPKLPNVSPAAETFQLIEGYTEHKVRRKETSYSISKQYNLTVDELIKANPTINPDKLKSGTLLRIPKKSESTFNTKSLVERNDSLVKQKIDTFVEPKKDTITPVLYEPIFNKPFTGVLNIALLLPFSIDEIETRAKLDSIAALKKPNKIVKSELFPRTVYSLEFYQGFLIAVDSLKKTGLSVKVHTFDTGWDASKINNILSKQKMAGMDLIIGPLFNEGLEKVNEFSLSKQIKLVSLIIKDNVNLTANPYSFQLLPDKKTSIDALLSLIKSYEKKKILFIENNNVEDAEIIKLFKERLNVFFPEQYKTVKYTGSTTSFTKLYSETEDNILIVPSYNEVYISSIFSKLNLDAKLYSIKVFGLPECARVKNIDQTNYLHNLEFHYYSPFYFDYSNPSIKRFVYLYNRAYSFDPQDFANEGFNFALLGFDLGNYFMRILSKPEPSFEQTLINTNIDPLHMKIRFEKDSVNGGFLNKEVQLLKFAKDYYIRKVN